MKKEDAKLGAVIRMKGTGTNRAYSCCTIKQIEDGKVKLFRPYVHANGCVYSGNSVILYIGIEEYTISESQLDMYDLLNKGPDLY